MEYEQTLLRDIFKDEMEVLQLGWNATHGQSSVRADSEQALSMCEELLNDQLRPWLEETKAGKLLRIHDECDNENWREEQGTA